MATLELDEVAPASVSMTRRTFLVQPENFRQISSPTAACLVAWSRVEGRRRGRMGVVVVVVVVVSWRSMSRENPTSRSAHVAATIVGFVLDGHGQRSSTRARASTLLSSSLYDAFVYTRHSSSRRTLAALDARCSMLGTHQWPRWDPTTGECCT